MLRDLLKKVEGNCVLCARDFAVPELECRDCGGAHAVCLPCVREWGLGGREATGPGQTAPVLTTCPDGVLLERELRGVKPPRPNAELQDGLFGKFREAMAEKDRGRP